MLHRHSSSDGLTNINSLTEFVKMKRPHRVRTLRLSGSKIFNPIISLNQGTPRRAPTKTFYYSSENNVLYISSAIILCPSLVGWQ